MELSGTNDPDHKMRPQFQRGVRGQNLLGLEGVDDSQSVDSERPQAAEAATKAETVAQREPLQL